MATTQYISGSSGVVTARDIHNSNVVMRISQLPPDMRNDTRIQTVLQQIQLQEDRLIELVRQRENQRLLPMIGQQLEAITFSLMLLLFPIGCILSTIMWGVIPSITVSLITYIPWLLLLGILGFLFYRYYRYFRNYRALRTQIWRQQQAIGALVKQLDEAIREVNR